MLLGRVEMLFDKSTVVVDEALIGFRFELQADERAGRRRRWFNRRRRPPVRAYVTVFMKVFRLNAARAPLSPIREAVLSASCTERIGNGKKRPNSRC